MIGIYLAGAIHSYYQEYVASVAETICAISDAVVIHSYKGNKANRLLNIDCDRLLYFDNKNFDCWSELKENAVKFLKDNGIDIFIILTADIYNGWRYNDMSLLHKFCESRNTNDRCNWNFQMTKNLLCKYMIIESAFDVCDKVYQFVLDTGEPDFSVCCEHFGYDKSKYRLLYIAQRKGIYTYMPCVEYGMMQKVKNADIDIYNKDTDFSFYASAVSKAREWVLEYKDMLQSIQNSIVEIIEKGTDKRQIPQMEYMQLLGSSKFTLAISAYDAVSFSTMRMIDAAMCNCLCLIHNSCNDTDLKATFPDIYRIYKKYDLFVEMEDIKDFISRLTNKKRNDIIREIKETKSWKRFSDINFIKKRWNKLL